MLLNGELDDKSRQEAGEDLPEILLLVMNSHHEAVPFTLPRIADTGTWHRLFDTDRPDTDAGNGDDTTAYDVPARSLQVLAWMDGSSD